MVTTLIARAGFDAPDTMAFVCGPEVMMRFAIKALEDAGRDKLAIPVIMAQSVAVRDHFMDEHPILYRDMIWMYGPLPVYLLALLFR